MSNTGKYWKALEDIRKIVHTPTSKTSYRTAQDHYAADFDDIRKIIDAAQR